jgi:hypothetical protein
MILEQAVFELLSTSPAVTALVGTRIYPHLAPEGAARPYIVQARTEGDNLATLSGRGVVDRVQLAIGCVAGDAVAAQNLSLAVRDALDGYNGGQTIVSARRAGQRSEYLDDVELHVVTGLYLILAAE